MYSFLFWLHMLISWWNVRLPVNMILHGLFFWIAHICSKTLRLYEELQCRKQFKPCLLLAFSLSFRQLYVYDTLQLVYFETPLHLSQLSLWKSWLQVLRLSFCFFKSCIFECSLPCTVGNDYLWVSLQLSTDWQDSTTHLSFTVMTTVYSLFDWN